MSQEKPQRTLGVSIAIIFSVLLFSVLPIVQMITVLGVRERFRAVEFLESGGAIGGDLGGVADSAILLQLVIGIAFIVIGFFAWRGRPSWIRWVLTLSVFAVTVLTVFTSLQSLAQPVDISQGISSGDAGGMALLQTRLVVTVLVSLYVIWYMNRGPARAFYRGYYLPEKTDPTTAH